MEELIARLVRRREELEELLVYRRAVEPAIARLAARTRTEADLEAMRDTIAKMVEALTEPDYMRLDTEFHLAVARATRNRHLTHVIEEIRTQLNDALSLLPESETWHRRISGEHEAIFDAIEAGDPDAAGAAAELHVASSDKGVRAVLAAIFTCSAPALATENDCEREMARAARSYGVPLGVLYAVGLAETGRGGSLRP